jgi:hypothetical protein
MYIKQLLTIEMIVIVMPNAELRQPVTSMWEDGQSTYIRSVWPTMSTPATPNHSKAKTIPDTIRPIVMPSIVTALMLN